MNNVLRDARILREHDCGHMTDKEFVEWFERQPWSTFRKRFSIKGGRGYYVSPIGDAYVPKKPCPECGDVMKLIYISDDMDDTDTWWQCTSCDYSMEP